MIKTPLKAARLAACLLAGTGIPGSGISVGILVGILVGIPGFASTAAAHHSTAAYDYEHSRTVEGVVKQVNWSNPHVTFNIEIDDKEGPNPGTLVFEVSSPGVLTRSGWTKRSLQPGDRATFFYAPLRDGRPGGFLRKVTLPNGQELTFSLTPAEEQ
jgi:hypothetical protein